GSTLMAANMNSRAPHARAWSCAANSEKERRSGPFSSTICFSRCDSGSGRDWAGGSFKAKLLRQTDSGPGPGQDRRAELGRTRGTVGEDAIEFRRIAAKLVQAAAD